MAIKGIDVSYHNGVLNHKKIKDEGIEFAIVRAGYGKNNIDKQFINNMNGFIDVGVPIGAYWFLYSLTPVDAKQEADYFNEALKPYRGMVSFPVACDFEYDSEKYMIKNGITPSKRLNTDIVKAFCYRMMEHGWYVVNYANIDFINNHFHQSELEMFDLWCAQWRKDSCFLECGIWQYSSDGKVNGSSARTDMNWSYKDYPTIIKTAGLNGYGVNKGEIPEEELIEQLAKECIAGIWGNGQVRVSSLKTAGYDYKKIQKKINELLSHKKLPTTELALEVISGKYGNGEKRKQGLEEDGYVYEEVQKLVNEILSKRNHSIRENIIALCNRELGVAEPTGDDKYINWFNKNILKTWSFALDVPWCSIFVSYAGINGGLSQEDFPAEANCDEGMKWFKNRNQFEYGSQYGGRGYIPNMGDVIYYSSKFDQNDSDHVGWVEKCDGEKIIAIEGNKSNKVGKREIHIDNPYILGYGIINYPDEYPEVEELEEIKEPEIIKMVQDYNGDYIPEECCTMTNPDTSENGISVIDDCDLPCFEDCSDNCNEYIIQKVMNDYARITNQLV